MKRILKITGIGCGGLFGLVILLGIIGAATGGGSRSATPTAIAEAASAPTTTAAPVSATATTKRS